MPETIAQSDISNSTPKIGSNSKTRNNNQNNKNKNTNKNKKTSESRPQEGSSTDNQSQSKRSLNNPKPKNKKKNNNSKKLPRPKPIYQELKTLLSTITPITINGIPVKNLSSDPLPFLEKIINDKSNNDEIFMTFFLKPSDPEFPFDLELLTLTLCIPQSYPNNLPSPTIMVLNDDIPRGYGLNIELGFKQIVATILENRLNKKYEQKSVEEKEKKTDTIKKGEKKNIKSVSLSEEPLEEELKIDVVNGNDLLGMIKTLDKYLEKFLTMEKKDTIKLVKVINKKQEDKTAKERKEKLVREKKEKERQSKMVDLQPLDQEKYQKRNGELERLRQRLKNNYISVFKDNSQGTTFKFCLFFEDDHLTLEFDESDQIVIEKLHIRLIVPKDYLSNSKKGLKLAIDMTNSHNIELVNSIEDKSVRLIFGKLVSNISKNFDIFATDIAAAVCMDTESDNNSSWTITSQLNFFIQNIQKFMNERAEFQSWYSANKAMNDILLEGKI